MGGNIVLNLVKTGVLILLCIIAFLAVRQYDSFEDRILEVKSLVEETKSQTRDNAEAMRKLRRENADALSKLRRELKRRTVVGPADPGEADPGGDDPDEDEGGSDPRELPYWPTEDNVLIDTANEPAPAEDAPRGGNLNYYIGSNLSSLNQHTLNEAQLADNIAAFVYQKLAIRSRVNPDDYIGEMANRVTISEDKTVFTIYLQKGLLWHPAALSPRERTGPRKWLADLGTPEVTAHDVKFTFDVIRNPLSEASNEASYLTDIKFIEVIDDYTIRITWSKKRYYNKSSTLSLLAIYPRHIFGRDESGNELPLEEAAQIFPQHWYNKRMCGSGPYRFVEFVDNAYIKLERFDRFVRTGPAADAMTIHIISDPEVRLQRFKAGELDVCQMEPAQYRSEYLDGGPGSVKEMIDSGKAELRKWEGATYYYIAWNQRRPIFREAAVRRALAHAFPKARVARDVYAGLAIPHDSPVHSAESSYLKDLEQFEFNTDTAARLLDEAGWKTNDKGVRAKVIDGRMTELRFNILVVNSRVVYRDFSLLFKKELAKIGVIMELQVREWNQLIKTLDDKEYDAVTLGWGTSWDSDPEQIWHSRQADVPRGSNHCSYKSPIVDAAIEGLQVEFDNAERKKLWATFQRTIVKDQPYLFLSIPLRPWLINTRCGNTFFNKLRPQIWLLPWTIKEPG